MAPWAPAFPAKGQPGEHIEDTLSSQVVKFIRDNKDRPFFVNYWQFSVHAPYDAKPELVAKYRQLADSSHPQRNPVYAAMVESLDDGSDQFELYHLKDDLGETTNLAASRPELVRELNALIDGFLKDTQAVIPKRNPNYNPSAVPPRKKGVRENPAHS